MTEPEQTLDPLTRLAIRYGTDKFGGHLYTPAYYELLKDRREAPVRLLEIGVGGYNEARCGGASLRMWAEFFGNGRIVGLDYNVKKLALPPRVSVAQGSQDDIACLQRLHEAHGPFDIVIDDGSHDPMHMMASFLYLYSLMAPDGIYIIEDTQTCFVPAQGGNASASGTIYTLAHLVALQMHRAEGYEPGPGELDLSPLADHTVSVSFLRNVVCFKRGDNKYPSNRDLSLTDPAVAAVFNVIGAEAERNPAPRSVLSRIDMCNWAGQYEVAGELAKRAMAAWPADLELMRELLFFMTRMNQFTLVGALQRRIEALEAMAATLR
jgi:hypothetical protein